MSLKFGISFFPNVGPDEKSAADYWSETLDLVGLCDALGFTSVRTVEHYFHRYGGYSTNPLVFLAAAAQRTRTARLLTGAILPVFNHPLKLAGEIGMLDAISGGRVEIGLARAFLPHEFARFGVNLDESRERFDEGLEQIRRLLEEENVTMDGKFHRFRNVTSLPRPTQTPRPPFWVAALSTKVSFEAAGRNGHGLMAIPLAAEAMAELIGTYREAWRSAGHLGSGRVLLSFYMYTANDTAHAVEIFRPHVNGYLRALVDATADWLNGASTAAYPGYDKIIAGLKSDSFDSQRAKGTVWVGTPAEVLDVIADYRRRSGGFEIASLNVTPHMMPVDAAARSMRLFSQAVMPKVG